MSTNVKTILWLIYGVVFTIVDMITTFMVVSFILLSLVGKNDFSIVYNILLSFATIYVVFMRFMNIAIFNCPNKIAPYDVKVTVKDEFKDE
jgi:hypothetical protein